MEIRLNAVNFRPTFQANTAKPCPIEKNSFNLGVDEFQYWDYNTYMSTDKTDSQKPWTASSLAEAAGIRHTYVARLCRQGKLRAEKFGQAWLIPYDEGLRWLEERREKQSEEI